MEAKLLDVYLSLYVLNWLEKNRDKAEKRFRDLLLGRLTKAKVPVSLRDTFKRVLNRHRVFFDFEYCESTSFLCIRGFVRIEDEESPKLPIFEVHVNEASALPKLENVSVKPLDPEENTLMSFMLFLISKSFPV